MSDFKARDASHSYLRKPSSPLAHIQHPQPRVKCLPVFPILPNIFRQVPIPPEMTSTIAPGSIVLVTGVNGYIASHVADQLLESGFNVRGTVRDVQKAAGLVERWETKFGRGRIELVIVKDITVPEAFDSAVEGSWNPPGRPFLYGIKQEY